MQRFRPTRREAEKPAFHIASTIDPKIASEVGGPAAAEARTISSSCLKSDLISANRLTRSVMLLSATGPTYLLITLPQILRWWCQSSALGEFLRNEPRSSKVFIELGVEAPLQRLSEHGLAGEAYLLHS